MLDFFISYTQADRLWAVRLAWQLEEAGYLNEQGNALYSAGQYAEAGPSLEKALAIHEKVLGPEHPDTATSLNNLAELYRAQGRYAEALPFYQRALASREKTLGLEYDDTLSTMNILALVLFGQGDMTEARCSKKSSLRCTSGCMVLITRKRSSV